MRDHNESLYFGNRKANPKFQRRRTQQPPVTSRKQRDSVFSTSLMPFLLQVTNKESRESLFLPKGGHVQNGPRNILSYAHAPTSTLHPVYLFPPLLIVRVSVQLSRTAFTHQISSLLTDCVFYFILVYEEESVLVRVIQTIIQYPPLSTLLIIM